MKSEKRRCRRTQVAKVVVCAGSSVISGATGYWIEEYINYYQYYTWLSLDCFDVTQSSTSMGAAAYRAADGQSVAYGETGIRGEVVPQILPPEVCESSLKHQFH
eukprot:5181999-Amphidinium_carterae.1